MTDEQITNDELSTMTPEQISAARKTGKLDQLLGVTAPTLSPVTSEEGAAHLAAGNSREALAALITERNNSIENQGA